MPDSNKENKDLVPISDILQKENILYSGDMAGRDIVKIYRPTKTTLSYLYAKLKDEEENDKNLKEFIEELKHFTEPIDVKLIGLEEKLSSANRGYKIDEAKRVKELFTKKLLQHQFSKAAQEIYAHILGLLHASFEYKVAPKIREGLSESAVDSIVFDEVLKPISTEYLEENVLNICMHDLNGMLYFLTGNCHINWTY